MQASGQGALTTAPYQPTTPIVASESDDYTLNNLPVDPELIDVDETAIQSSKLSNFRDSPASLKLKKLTTL